MSSVDSGFLAGASCLAGSSFFAGKSNLKGSSVFSGALDFSCSAGFAEAVFCFASLPCCGWADVSSGVVRPAFGGRPRLAGPCTVRMASTRSALRAFGCTSMPKDLARSFSSGRRIVEIAPLVRVSLTSFLPCKACYIRFAVAEMASAEYLEDGILTNCAK